MRKMWKGRRVKMMKSTHGSIKIRTQKKLGESPNGQKRPQMIWST